jgi:hypothetical protein
MLKNLRFLILIGFGLVLLMAGLTASLNVGLAAEGEAG